MQFPTEKSNKLKWRLKLELIRKEDNAPDYFKLTLDRNEYFFEQAKIICSIMNHEETEQRKLCKVISNKPICFEPFIYCSKLFDAEKDYLPNDQLTICCQIRLLTDTVCTCGTANPIKVPENKVAEDFGKLFNNEQFSDVKLMSNGHKIYAHKNILSARSQFFEAMFQKEPQDCVILNDMDAKIMMALVRFIYTDEVTNLDKHDKQLLEAAHKFKLAKLKALSTYTSSNQNFSKPGWNTLQQLRLEPVPNKAQKPLISGGNF
ncbi:speckle-type POZ protein-like [Drosophila hydei]|uniref:Speckle-type POZ protein-like n=1 Tax=Drosophila hydei TaxID=7224 RepID=A0A6J1LR55_DROHY|nr:speckle-type POZ protein-like [Drosophila hydei]